MAHPGRVGLALLAALELAATGGAVMADEGVTLHVGTNGKDVWSGRLAAPRADGTDGPLASLTGARDALRRLRQSKPILGPVTVLVQGGVYRLTEPVIFEPVDSGTAETPVSYAASDGQKPIFSGGRVITGWRKGAGSIWSVELPEVKAGKWAFRQLFINGRRAILARTPNDGFHTVQGEVVGVAPPGGPQPEPSHFQFRQDDILPGHASSGVEVVILQAWAEARLRIAKVDAQKRIVTLDGTCSPSNREANARYWLENALELLDSPGEWHLDTAKGVLSYWPRAGEDLATAEVVAPVMEELVRFAGDPAAGALVRHIHLGGLEFRHADWTLGPRGYADVQAAFDIPAAISLRGAVACRLERCRIAQVGRWGVELGEGCKENILDGCELTDVGAGGVKIGLPTQPDKPVRQASGNIVRNCRIHDIGIVYPAAVGVWIGQSYDNRISHNAIYDTYYSAVSVGWTWGYGPTLARGNIIELNLMHDIGRGLLSDMGGVYTLGVQPGTVIRNNVIHDVSSHGYGGWGLYTDEGSAGIVLVNNLVYRTKSGGFHQHYGKENIVRNNIFAFAREAQLIRTRQEEHSSFTFERNLVLFDEGDLLGGNWGNDKYTMDNNLYWDARSRALKFGPASLAEWRRRGHDAHSVIADPKFAHPDKNDFSLPADSPALKLGFQPFDPAKAGPEK